MDQNSNKILDVRFALVTGMGVLAAIAFAFFAISKNRRGSRLRLNHLSHPSKRHSDCDCVDETSWESFPASDPPGNY